MMMRMHCRVPPHQIWREVCKYIQTENKTDTDRLISGTYIHPDLVPSVAGWISPLFQLKANRVVNGYIMEEWKAKLDASELNANHLLLQLQTSDAIIDNLQCSLEEKDALISVNDINEAINQQSYIQLNFKMKSYSKPGKHYRMQSTT